ncbi:MAG TPA: dienelactone hydrolase family protein [Bryobacteraceae bacterium]|nr:dienelactone hydrolase family protein [Bryobacteraceae bacterium]
MAQQTGVVEEELEVRTADGTADSVLYHPEGTSRFPGVIFLTDIGGIRPAMRDMALRLLGEGYVVLMPNVFYRTGRTPLFDFPRTPGDERTMKRFAELASPLTPEAMERDASTYVDFLAAQPSVRPGAMGVVGYCFTGAMAMRMAAVRPEKIASAASFHGGRLYTDTPTSPHLTLPKIKARLYFGHATNDRSMPEEAIQKLNSALTGWGGKYESEIYPGAHHGWTVPDSPVYNEPQAGRAHQKLLELLAATLK